MKRNAKDSRDAPKFGRLLLALLLAVALIGVVVTMSQAYYS